MSRGRLREHRRTGYTHNLEVLRRANLPCLGHRKASTSAHEERLHTVTKSILDSGAVRVLDIGCGSGDLLQRLAQETQFVSLVGIDPSITALKLARARLFDGRAEQKCDVTLRQGSIISLCQNLNSFDAAAMVELIEHISPHDLPSLERNLFCTLQPGTIIITTPNKEFNVRLGLLDHEFRHPDHCFEWTRFQFRGWALQVAKRNGYGVCFSGIGQMDPELGSLTQMAVFTRQCNMTAT